MRRRDVWFAETGFTPTPVHWRDGLTPGTQIVGPAIIEAMDSTTVVPPGWQARIDELGIHCHCEERATKQSSARDMGMLRARSSQ